jgi:arginyl-tRNA synthetase
MIRSVLDYEFDWARCTSFEGDFGPYIQYSHVRLCSVERKNPNIILPENRDEINTSLLTEEKCKILIKQLATYPAVVKVAYENSEPSKIVEWCFKTSHLVSQAWETIKVSGQEEELARARLYLFISTRDVLSSAMRLLSLTPLERM